MLKVDGKWVTIVPPRQMHPLIMIPDSFAESGYSQSNFMMITRFVSDAITGDINKRKTSAIKFKLKEKFKGVSVEAKKNRFIIRCMLLSEYERLGLNLNGALLQCGIRLPFGLHLEFNAGLLQGNVDRIDPDFPHFRLK